MERRRVRRRGGHLLLLAGAIALAAVAVVVILSLLPKRGKPVIPVNPYVGMVRVSDGSNLVWLTPQEGVAVSRLYRRDFATGTDGMIYRGERYTARRGVDMSVYQGKVDWDKVAGSGVEFALLRIGYRGSTQGALNPDTSFETYYTGAAEGGIDVGLYFFSQALTAEEGQEEAEYVLSLLEGRALALPVYFDWETISSDESRSAGYDLSALTDSAEAFCRTIEAAGYDAGVYLNRQQGYYHYDLSRLTDFSLWLADPNDYPDFYYAADVWQYSFEGSVPGIDAPVDLNLRFLPVS